MDVLKEQIRTGNDREVAALVRRYLEEGRDPETILKQAMIPAMDEVGDLFQRGEYFLPEMLIAARAMKEGLRVLKPRLVQAGVEPAGRVVLGTVQGDMHDIGKNLVAMTLEGAGFEVIDLGVDVSPDKFAAEAKAKGANLIGMSALLTTTMPGMEKTIKALKQAGVTAKVMVGGAPVTQTFAEKIGAHGYAPDAASAVDTAKSLVA